MLRAPLRPARSLPTLDAVTGPAEKGVAITTADEFGWIRARSIKFTDAALDEVVDATRDFTPKLPGLDPPADDT